VDVEDSRSEAEGDSITNAQAASAAGTTGTNAPKPARKKTSGPVKKK
jgi:hypothetical protein